jgi:hypothetical protein
MANREAWVISGIAAAFVVAGCLLVVRSVIAALDEGGLPSAPRGRTAAHANDVVVSLAYRR